LKFKQIQELQLHWEYGETLRKDKKEQKVLKHKNNREHRNDKIIEQDGK